MTHKTARRTLCAFVVGAVTLTAGGVVSLRAQGAGGNPFTPVLAKLDQILGILTTTPPGSGSVFLSTPIVRWGPGDAALCFVANVGTATVDIRLRMVGFATELINVTHILAPGNSYFAGTAVNDTVRCEFSFEGAAAAVRANLLVQDTSGHTLVSVDAR